MCPLTLYVALIVFSPDSLAFIVLDNSLELSIIVKSSGKDHVTFDKTAPSLSVFNSYSVLSPMVKFEGPEIYTSVVSQFSSTVGSLTVILLVLAVHVFPFTE